MTKKEKIDLAISLALGRSRLTEDCVKILSDLTQADLVIEHGMNDIQSNLIMTWCKHEKQRLFDVSWKELKDQ